MTLSMERGGRFLSRRKNAEQICREEARGPLPAPTRALAQAPRGAAARTLLAHCVGLDSNMRAEEVAACGGVFIALMQNIPAKSRIHFLSDAQTHH